MPEVVTALAMLTAPLVMTKLPNLILVKAWHIQDVEAMAIIVGIIVDEVLPHLQMTNTSFEAWTTL